MQAEFAHRRRDARRELSHAVFVRGVRQHNKARAVEARGGEVIEREASRVVFRDAAGLSHEVVPVGK